LKVSSVKIEHFRGIRSGFIKFGKHPVFVGDNNTGKTTLIEAMALLLGRDRMVRDLTEHDFFGSHPGPVDRIKLVATLTDYPNDDPEQSSHWFRDGKAVVKWVDEATVQSIRNELTKPGSFAAKSRSRPGSMKSPSPSRSCSTFTITMTLLIHSLKTDQPSCLASSFKRSASTWSARAAHGISILMG
jgi:hypothetical protein